MTLNKEQEEAAEDIVKFINGDLDIPYFTLTGSPGTGKSYMLKEALRRANRHMFDRSAAAIAHSAKNVLNEMLGNSIPCYTVAQWLGMKMTYDNIGNILFKQHKSSYPILKDSRVAVLDEASMINDELYNSIMQIVTDKGIKLIAVGDIFQLPPVGQEHDSKLFDRIDAVLSTVMRFSGPITNLASIYKQAIQEINDGYIGNPLILNEKTNRNDSWDTSLDSGYYFKNNIYELIEQIADEIKSNPDNLNYARMLAYKNNSVDLLNKSIRTYIYGEDKRQFEHNEIVISKGGFTDDKTPIIHNGKLLRVEGVLPIIGPYEIPCLSMKFKNFSPIDNVTIPVVMDTNEATDKYEKIKKKLADYAKQDPRQWPTYYKFVDSFAYFDYGYSSSVYKAQGQTLSNVYVLEGEVMGVKPLTLKQKFQALYVAVTRAKNSLYIYNKDY